MKASSISIGYIFYAFLKKELLDFRYYAMTFIQLSWRGIILLNIFYWSNRFLNRGEVIQAFGYNADYYSFIFIGIAVNFFLFFVIVVSLPMNVAREYVTGVFEFLITTPNNHFLTILLNSILDIFLGLISLACLLFLGTKFLGVNLSNINYFSAMIILLLSIVLFVGIGTILASAAVIFKDVGYIFYPLIAIFTLFGGVYFPAEIFSNNLQIIPKMIPITYSLRALRLSIFNSYSIVQLRTDILILGYFALFSLLIGVLSLNFAVKRVRENGTISHY